MQGVSLPDHQNMPPMPSKSLKRFPTGVPPTKKKTFVIKMENVIHTKAASSVSRNKEVTITNKNGCLSNTQ